MQSQITNLAQLIYIRTVLDTLPTFASNIIPKPMHSAIKIYRVSLSGRCRRDSLPFLSFFLTNLKIYNILNLVSVRGKIHENTYLDSSPLSGTIYLQHLICSHQKRLRILYELLPETDGKKVNLEELIFTLEKIKNKYEDIAVNPSPVRGK